MARSKPGLKQKRRRTTLPAMGAAGLSLALAGGASATTNGTGADTQSRDNTRHHEIIIGDEELADVSLLTFHVFDKENDLSFVGNVRVARCGCGGCRGCGGGCRCGGGCGVARCGVGCAGCARCRCGVGCGCGIVVCGVTCGGCSCCITWGYCQLC
jgi:hypothetical protein